MRPALIILAASALLLSLNLSSCVVVQPHERHDNGLHKGWYKNPNNPHNPANGSTQKAATGNNGKGKGKNKQP